MDSELCFQKGRHLNASKMFVKFSVDISISPQTL